MSFDLMVFEASAAPSECAAFVRWYDAGTEWSELPNYDDPKVASPALLGWYQSMRATFPAMNGPDATDDYDNDRVTGYSIAATFIYADFRWSRAEEAYDESLKWARHYRLGFYDVSQSGDVWLPVEGGDYRVLHCGSTSG